VLPADWGRTLERPRAYKLPDAEHELLARYEHGGTSTQLRNILAAAHSRGATAAFIEAPYVDFDYRAEYSNLYARHFVPPPDRCERLILFADSVFLGFSVMRPTHKTVGRTAMAPPTDIDRFVSCRAEHRIRPYGDSHAVKAFPFMSQDGQYGRCAHAAIWAVARYHHLVHKTAKHSIAAVVEAAGTRETVDRTTASEGLYLHEVAGALRGLGLPAKAYDPDPERPPRPGETLATVVCRYLNSGFPVMVNTPGHLTVLVGYGQDGDDIFFIRADDNRGPYERVDSPNTEDDRLGQWDMMLVPFPARIHVPGEAAEIAAGREFLRLTGVDEETSELQERHLAQDFRLRTYARDAADYKIKLAERQPVEEIVLHHRTTPASAWVWVTEFHERDADGQECVVGEVVMDATSHPARPRLVMANIPGRCFQLLPEDTEPRKTPVPDGGLYTSALPDRRV
jgi:hypothetical protein